MKKLFNIKEINDIKIFNFKTGEEIKPYIPKEDNSEKYNINISQIQELIALSQKNKVIELEKTYYTVEWSWQPICDGRFVYEEIIREHKIVNNIDVYFTNKNYRRYLKEDLYENKEDALKMCAWQNSFGYDYETKISRDNLIKNSLESENIGNKIIWKIIK